MRRPIQLWSLGAALFVVAGERVAAQGGTIQGRVVDSTDSPVTGAVVAVSGTALRATVGTTGRYVLRSVPAGTRTVEARALGFAPLDVRVTVAEGETVSRDLILARSLVKLAPVNVMLGSHARHTAADELAVPVDVISQEQIAQQGTTETSQVLQNVIPSVNFPRSSIADADDIVRPFTMRGLSPDHTLVLVNGVRRHRTALTHVFAYGMGAGSSGVDLNAFPSSAIGRIDVLRDGASAQYGSDAIAGVVNLVLKDGTFAPYLDATVGGNVTNGYSYDGTTADVNGGWGIKVGRGSLGVFAEYRYREPTNRAWADPADQIVAGDHDSVGTDGKVIVKRNGVAQPNYHWGDGLAKDLMTFLNFAHPLSASGATEAYAFGGYSYRVGTGNGFRRLGIEERNWPEIYPLGFLPEFRPDVKDGSIAAGVRGGLGGWNYDVSGSFGQNVFDYHLNNTLNVSLGPCLGTPCAPGPDGILGTPDDPGIPNQTSFFAGALTAKEAIGSLNVNREVNIGLPSPLNIAAGFAYRHETYQIQAGDSASWIDGGHLDRDSLPAPTGSQVFAGFRPLNEIQASRDNVALFVDLENNVTKKLLANVAGRFEHYSDFGSRLTGKLALRYQPVTQWAIRGAVSTGFRAPSLAQEYYSTGGTTTYVLDTLTGLKSPIDFRILRTNDPLAIALGAKPLRDETSVNASAGFAWTPQPSFTMTVDGYYTKLSHRISLSGLLSGPVVESILVAAGSTSLKSAQYFSNGLTTQTTGVDVTADYRVPLSRGTLELLGTYNYTQNKILEEDPLEPPLAAVGLTLLDPLTRIAIEKERPSWRATLEGTYSLSRFRGLLRGSAFGPFSSIQLSADPTLYQTYGTKFLVDAEVGYVLNQVQLFVGARNLFDTYPDKASEGNSFDTFPWPAPSPFGYNGRFLYARMAVTLGT